MEAPHGTGGWALVYVHSLIQPITFNTPINPLDGINVLTVIHHQVIHWIVLQPMIFTC